MEQSSFECMVTSEVSKSVLAECMKMHERLMLDDMKGKNRLGGKVAYNRVKRIYEGMQDAYLAIPLKIQIDTVRKYYADDLNTIKQKDKMKQQIKEYNAYLAQFDENIRLHDIFFLTLRYDQEYFRIEYFPLVIDKLQSAVQDGCPLFKEMYWSHEYHGERPAYHTHLVVKSDAHKSKIMERLKKILMGKRFPVIKLPNMIDINTEENMDSMEVMMKYLRGEKKDEKMEYVEADRKWKLENNIIDKTI